VRPFDPNEGDAVADESATANDAPSTGDDSDARPSGVAVPVPNLDWMCAMRASIAWMPSTTS
jgi:hypothetical protein